LGRQFNQLAQYILERKPGTASEGKKSLSDLFSLSSGVSLFSMKRPSS
jgi:hypothetical protein